MAIFNLTNRADRLRGGNNVADQFIIDAADDLQAADTISGGTGSVVDVLTISFGGTYAFNQATASAMLVGIERIDITGGATALYVGTGSTLTNVAALRVTGGAGGDIVAMVPNQVAPLASPFGLWIEGNGGADSLYGTDLGDTLFGGADNDLLIGHGGNDRGDAGAGGAVMDGGTGSDTLVGGAGNDRLAGREGDDSLEGAGGDDSMTGGDGADYFDGGEGNDTFRGEGNGADTAFGGAGDDLLVFGSGGGQMADGDGNNTLRGGAGNDVALSAGGGADRFEDAGAGDDFWFLTPGISGFWDAGSGNDFLHSYRDVMVVLAGDGHDTMIGRGADSVQGGAGNDLYGDSAVRREIASASSHDIFDAGEGDDWMLDGEGNDTMLGGAGNDLMASRTLIALSNQLFPVTDGDTVYLQPWRGALNVTFDPGGNDSFDGGSGDDTFDAGIGNDTVDGGIGNDVILVGSGDDSVIGGSGDDRVEVVDSPVGDTLQGGSGVDRLVLQAATVARLGSGGIAVTGFEVIEATGTATLRLTMAGLGDMTVSGAAGGDRVDARGQLNDVALSGNGGNDTMIGGAAADTLTGGEANDSLAGLNGFDLLEGGAGSDSLDGGNGNDTLEDGEGDDRLAGGGGWDVLRLGTGNDTALGGAGADTVLATLSAVTAADLIAGGEGADLLSLTASGGDVLAPAAADRLSGFERLAVERTGGEGAVFITIGDAMVDSIGVPFRVELSGALLHVDGSNVSDTGFIAGGGGQSTLLGGGGADSLSAGSAGSRIEGREGADLLALGAGADTLWGGGGDDVILAGEGGFGADDLIAGDAGIDTLRFTGIAGIGFGPGSLARVEGIERIELANESNDLVLRSMDLLRPTGTIRILGGSESDFIDASARATAIHLMGAAGDDILSAGDGADTLDGGTGSDLLLGGKGADRLLLGDLDGGDVVDGGTGVDTLALDIGGRRVAAGLLSGVQGIEVLELTMQGGRVALPAGMLTGSEGLEVRVLSAAASGGAVNAAALARVTLLGGEGADSLLGGTGADTINGGAGADTLAGGRGADQFDLRLGGADTLRYGAPAEGGLLSGGRTIAAGDTVIGFGGDDEVVLQRSGFAGLGTGGALNIVQGVSVLLGDAVLLVDASGAISDFRSLAALNAGFGGQLRANGQTGDSAFILARNEARDSAALYWLRDGNDNAIIDAADTLSLLAVFTAGTLPTAEDFRLI